MWLAHDEKRKEFVEELAIDDTAQFFRIVRAMARNRQCASG